MLPFKTFRALSCNEKDVPEDSPLGCLLKHWKEGNFGQDLRRKTLIDYCNHVWPEYETGGMQWPWNGTLTSEILGSMMNYLMDNDKWDEIQYLDLFYYLKEKPEWQKACGLMVLKTMKIECDKCAGCKEHKLQFSREEEEDVSLLVSPSAPPLPPPEAPPVNPARVPLPSSSEEEEQEDWVNQPRTPLAGRTRRGRMERKGSLSQPQLMAPLREAVGADGGKVMVKVPFSPNDLMIWKQSAGAYRENPEKVARVVKMVIKTQNPDWNDLQVLLDTIMDSTEKEMVFRVMTNRARELIRMRVAQGSVNDLVPREDPEWNPNSSAEYKALKDYQDLLVEGVREGIPKTMNWSKLYSVRQDKGESPSAFLERLKETARRYTDLDVEAESGKLQLALIFMGQSQEDIRKKLQKLEGEDTRNLEKLLEVAWKVYNNREKETAKKQQASMLAVLQQATSGNNGNNRGRGRGRGRGSAGMGRGFGGFWNQGTGGRGRLGPNQCAFCKGLGHWKNECPLNQGAPVNGGFPGNGANPSNGLNPFVGNPQGIAQAFMMGNYQNQS